MTLQRHFRTGFPGQGAQDQADSSRSIWALLLEIRFDFWVVLSLQTGVELNSFNLTLWASFQLRIFSDSIIICLCYLVLSRNYPHVYCSSSRNSVENWITEITVCCMYCSLNKRGENQSRAEESNFSWESIAQILNKTEILGQSRPHKYHRMQLLAHGLL